MAKYKPYTNEQIMNIILENAKDIYNISRRLYAYMPWTMTEVYQKIVDYVTTPEIKNVFEANNENLMDEYSKYNFWKRMSENEEMVNDMLKELIRDKKTYAFTKKRINTLKRLVKKMQLNNFNFYVELYGEMKNKTYEELKRIYGHDEEKRQLKQRFLNYIRYTQIDKRKQSKKYTASRDLDKDVYYETIEGRIARIKGYLYKKYLKKCLIDTNLKAYAVLPEGVFVKPMKLINKTIPKASEAMKLTIAGLFEGVKDCHMVVDTNFKIAYDPIYNNHQDTDGDKASNYSCMSGEGTRAQKFYGKIDGCKVVRWELDDGTQVGRCIMYEWEGRKHYIRIYGNYDYHRTMINMLEAQMQPDDLFGREKKIADIKLPTKMDYDTPTMYLDGNYYGLKEIKGKWYMVADKYDCDCKTTSGDTIEYLLEETCQCDHCGNRVASDEGYWINDCFYCCSDCAHAAGYHYCERCDEWVHEDDAIWAGDNCYCSEYCAKAAGYEYDDYNKEWVDSDDLGVTDDGRYNTTQAGAADYYGVNEVDVEWDQDNNCWKNPKNEQEQENEGEENVVQEQ